MDYATNCSKVLHEIRHSYGYAVGRHIPQSNQYYCYNRGSWHYIPLEEALVTGIIDEKTLNMSQNISAKQFLQNNNYNYNNGYSDNSYRYRIGLEKREDW